MVLPSIVLVFLKDCKNGLFTIFLIVNFVLLRRIEVGLFSKHEELIDMKPKKFIMTTK